MCVCVCVCVCVNWELMLQDFELSHNATKAAKNICCEKGQCSVDHSREIRWWKKFRKGCKDLDNKTRSGRHRTMDSKAIEANSVSSSRRVSDELEIVIVQSGSSSQPQQKHPELLFLFNNNYSCCITT